MISAEVYPHKFMHLCSVLELVSRAKRRKEKKEETPPPLVRQKMTRALLYVEYTMLILLVFSQLSFCPPPPSLHGNMHGNVSVRLYLYIHTYQMSVLHFGGLSKGNGIYIYIYPSTPLWCI